MKFTTELSKSFASQILDTSYLLDESIDWIKNNLSPEDVFDRTQLEDWARMNAIGVKSSSNLGTDNTY